MRYTIEHRGVPVGIIEPKALDDLTAADVQPLPGYEAIRPVVRAGTSALRNLGFLGPAAEPASAEAAPPLSARRQRSRASSSSGMNAANPSRWIVST